MGSLQSSVFERYMYSVTSSRKYVHISTHFSKSPLNCDQNFLRPMSWMVRRSSSFLVYYCRCPNSKSIHISFALRRMKNRAMKNMENWGLYVHVVDLVKPRVIRQLTMSCHRMYLGTKQRQFKETTIVLGDQIAIGKLASP